MGKFTRWLKEHAPPRIDGQCDDVYLVDGKLYKGPRPDTKKALELGDTHPLSQLSEIDLVPGTQLEKRVTATRLVALGVFALAAQKKSGGEWWLVVDGADFAWAVQVDRKDVAEAREFVTKVKVAAKSAV